MSQPISGLGGHLVFPIGMCTSLTLINGLTSSKLSEIGTTTMN